jgi:hypothetical protein
MRLGTLITSASLAVFAVALPASAAELITNGGFETAGGSAADAASWDEGANITRSLTGSRSGSANLFFNVNVPVTGTDAHQLGVPLAPGAFTFEFYYKGDTVSAGGLGQFAINYIGAGGGSGVQNFVLAPTADYVLKSYAGTAPAGTTSANVYFYGVTGGDSGSTAVFHVDDVSLTQGGGTAVPEPASLGLLSLGALALVRRRRA